MLTSEIVNFRKNSKMMLSKREIFSNLVKKKALYKIANLQVNVNILCCVIVF
jgi:hypothetical protein